MSDSVRVLVLTQQAMPDMLIDGLRAVSPRSIVEPRTAETLEALRAGQIGGTALDVFEQEPLPSSRPLWGLSHVIVSPRVSGFTLKYDERAMALFAENLRWYVAGEPLLNAVDVRRGY